MRIYRFSWSGKYSVPNSRARRQLSKQLLPLNKKTGRFAHPAANSQLFSDPPRKERSRGSRDPKQSRMARPEQVLPTTLRVCCRPPQKSPKFFVVSLLSENSHVPRWLFASQLQPACLADLANLWCHVIPRQERACLPRDSS